MKSSPAKRAAVFLVLGLVATILFYFLSSGIDQSVDPVSLLPRDTAVLVDIKKLADDMNKLRKSKLGVQVKSIDWRQVLREIGVSDEYIRESITLVKEFDLISRSYVFNELFSNRVLLGLIPFVTDSSERLTEKKGVEQMIVLIARPKHPASFVDVFMHFFPGHLEESTQGYRGRAIRKFTYDKRFSFFTTVIEGLFIASLSQKPVEECIDNSIRNMTTGGSGLKDNPVYISLKQRARGRDDQFCFIDMNNLGAILSDTLYAGEYPPHSGYSPHFFLPERSALKRVAVFRTSGKRIRNYSGVVQFNRDIQELDSEVFHLYEPERDPIVSLLPDNNVVHLWTNILHAGRLWHKLSSSRASSTGALAQTVKNIIYSRTQYSIEDLLPLIGNQVSLNIAELKSSGIIPMPRISVYLQVHDRLTIEKMLMQLLAGLNVQHSIVRGTDIYSIILADGLMQPSFMFYDSFLVMADSRIQLENVLSLHTSSLLDSSLFKKVDIGLTEANNCVLYFRDAELINGIKELVRWYGALLQLFDERSAVNNRIIVEKIILPLLEGMKMYKVKTMRVLTEKDEVIFHSSQLLKKG